MKMSIRTMFIVFCFILLLGIVLNPVWRGAPPPQAQWAQQYTAPTGTVMEPDHGFFYYWFAYHVFFSQPQPTYHVHVYEAPQPSVHIYNPPYNPQPFHSAPTMKPVDVRTPAPNIRSNGGFAQTSPSTTRSGGGFSGSGGSSSTTRSGGGFSGSSSSRSSGSSGRSSGGFSSSGSSGRGRR